MNASTELPTHDSSTGTQSTDPDTEHDDAVAYKCPRCNTEYDHELLARVHLTRLQDDTHKNHDGLMPEATIEAVDENGDVLDTITRRPKNINVHDLTIDDFPDTYTDRAKHALLVAAHHPYETTYTELEKKTNTVLNEHDHGELSYGRVYSVVREFYENKTTNNTPTVVEQFDDLTQTQQAVVVARVAHPDDSQSQLANHIGDDGISRSYPYQVLERTEPIVDELRDQVENGDSVETAVKTITDDTVIHDLQQSGLIDNVDVEFTNVHDDTDNADDTVTDGPITTKNNVMTAAPDALDTTTNDDDQHTDTNDGNANEVVAVEHVETIRDQVELLDRVLEHPQATAVTTEIKTNLDEIINTTT